MPSGIAATVVPIDVTPHNWGARMIETVAERRTMMKRFGLVAALASLLITPPSGGRNVPAALKLFTEGSGAHVVVFESGLGDPAEPWKSVAHAVARSARVVRYDRAGLGQSPSSRRPRSASQIASELHNAFRSASLDPPYVFVSHSAGAWYALTFAARYTGEIQALFS
jgi:pimeloyl-ACP methyl ester carboxylesterase